MKVRPPLHPATSLTLLALISVLFVLASAVGAAGKEEVIQITAKRFEYSPSEITIKKGIPVVLEFTSLDTKHGFNCPGLGVRTDIYPQKVSRIRIVPEKAGTFSFHCDIFCGSGHEDMTGKIIVIE
jgi:cytochrome c oxidase subunit 2